MKSGHEEAPANGVRLQQAQRIGALVAELENDRLQIASGLRYAAALVGELGAFRRRVTGAGRAAYGAKTGAHDDLVVAVALAVWWGEKWAEFARS